MLRFAYSTSNWIWLNVLRALKDESVRFRVDV